MALRSMSPRITGALIGLALLSACGSTPTALTSPSQASSGFAVKQVPLGVPDPCNLVPFSYWGFGYGNLAFGLGASPFCASILATPFGIVPPPLVPFNYGAIGSALPYAGVPLLPPPPPCDAGFAAPCGAGFGVPGIAGSALPFIGANQQAAIGGGTEQSAVEQGSTQQPQQAQQPQQTQQPSSQIQGGNLQQSSNQLMGSNLQQSGSQIQSQSY